MAYAYDYTSAPAEENEIESLLGDLVAKEYPKNAEEEAQILPIRPRSTAPEPVVEAESRPRRRPKVNWERKKVRRKADLGKWAAIGGILLLMTVIGGAAAAIAYQVHADRVAALTPPPAPPPEPPAPPKDEDRVGSNATPSSALEPKKVSTVAITTAPKAVEEAPAPQPAELVWGPKPLATPEAPAPKAEAPVVTTSAPAEAKAPAPVVKEQPQPQAIAPKAEPEETVAAPLPTPKPKATAPKAEASRPTVKPGTAIGRIPVKLEKGGPVACTIVELAQPKGKIVSKATTWRLCGDTQIIGKVWRICERGTNKLYELEGPQLRKNGLVADTITNLGSCK